LRRGSPRQDWQSATLSKGADDDRGAFGKVEVGVDLFPEFIAADFGGDGAAIWHAVKA
jgi:hypothetical protein